ncbi:MAG: cell division protein FtsZ [Terrimicrobiaceae bacterium]|nr:cell division protein FtsZ [Terrimicrobiaceae bacterium]
MPDPMLEIPRTLLADATSQPSRILVIGVGNAGVALIDRITLAGPGGAADLVAINTDGLSLGSSVAERKILIGSKTARGLGTGGDPEVGAEAAEEAGAELAEAVSGAPIVIVCAGLGGGVGSGAAPIVVELARNRGALVIVVATMPFSFEGRRRVQQAAAARTELTRLADAFLAFENDRMAEHAEPLAGMHETFAASDQVLADTVASIIRFTTTSGPIRVTPADLLAVFREPDSTCVFGFAEAAGSNRANEAVERALKSPLLARGKSLAGARAILVHVAAPPDLHLAEVRAIMETVGRHTDGHLHLGVGLDPNRTSLAVSLLATSSDATAARAPRPARARTQPAPIEAAPEPGGESPAADPHPSEAPANASELFDTSPYAVARAGAKRPAKTEQKTLSLDPIARGRFEKSEPTIVGGEDLDVPTFLRQKIKLR